MNVNPAASAMLNNLFDYAGLFPPAALAMDEAAAEFSSLRLGEHRECVQRMVCPVAWLPELLERIPEHTEAPWPISVLGTSVDGFAQDRLAIESFEREAGARAYVEALEVKVGSAPLRKEALNHLVNAGFEEVFVEVPVHAEGLELLHMIADAGVIGAKGRTGGLEAAAFPSSASLAEWLYECVALDLPFKLTAGLHHAVRFHDPRLGAHHHGFVNVMAAVGLALTEDLSAKEMAAVLEAEVRFGADGLTWKERVLTQSEIQDARELFRSIGSCSIMEPIESLNQLMSGVLK